VTLATISSKILPLPSTPSTGPPETLSGWPNNRVSFFSFSQPLVTLAPWSISYNETTGYSDLKYINSSSLLYTHYSSIDGSVIDYFYLQKGPEYTYPGQNNNNTNNNNNNQPLFGGPTAWMIASGGFVVAIVVMMVIYGFKTSRANARMDEERLMKGNLSFQTYNL
jgi:hypothetical protein